MSDEQILVEKKTNWRKPVVWAYAAVIPTVIAANYLYNKATDFIDTANSTAAAVVKLTRQVEELQAQLKNDSLTTARLSAPSAVAAPVPEAAPVTPVNEIRPVPLPSFHPPLPVVARARKPLAIPAVVASVPNEAEVQPKKDEVPEAGKFTLLTDATGIASSGKFKLMGDK